MPKSLTQLKNAVVGISDGGRGFVISQRCKRPKWLLKRMKKTLGRKVRTTWEDRVIVTAAHCLPNLRAAHPWTVWNDYYPGLLGKLGEAPTIACECLFADPVNDIAVLGPTDSEELYEQKEAFTEIVENCQPFRIAPAKSGPGWVLTLEREWMAVTLEAEFNERSGWKWLGVGKTFSGQSGSPILNEARDAVGIICTDGRSQSVLTRDLPARWVLPRFT